MPLVAVFFTLLGWPYIIKYKFVVFLVFNNILSILDMFIYPWII
jgi:predicted transcriptional regulator